MTAHRDMPRTVEVSEERQAEQPGRLPKIFVFCNDGRCAQSASGEASHDWHEMMALAEDGTALAGHLCSAHGFAAHDMGVREGGRKRDLYAKHYPDGFEVVWVPHAKHCPPEMARAMRLGGELADEDPLAETPRDLQLTHAHRTLLRRIARGDEHDLGGLAHLLVDLRAHGLVDDDSITDAGRALLAAHDALGETRVIERPRPVEPTAPKGWRLTASGWCWVSPSEAVVVSFAVHADGRLSAPSVVGVGDFWLATDELRQAIEAQRELVEYLRARAEWERPPAQEGAR